MTPPLTDNIRLRNKKDRPALSGMGRGQISRVGVMAAGPVPKERDEKPVRKKIEQSRRPINYGKDRPQYRPDVVRKPVQKNVTKKAVPKPNKFTGQQAKFGGSRA